MASSSLPPDSSAWIPRPAHKSFRPKDSIAEQFHPLNLMFEVIERIIDQVDEFLGSIPPRRGGASSSSKSCFCGSGVPPRWFRGKMPLPQKKA
jgi:hypothetical protein